MSYVFELEIPECPISLNRAMRTYFKERKRLNDYWYDQIWLLSMGKRPKQPLSSAKITLIRQSYRMLDYDGLVASFKPIVDGLKHAKIIEDDKWSVTGKWEVLQLFRKKKDGQMICITVEGKDC